MYAVIIKHGSQFELQHRPTIDSRVVSFAEKSGNAEMLKRSLTLDWQRGNDEKVLWYAQYGL